MNDRLVLEALMAYQDACMHIMRREDVDQESRDQALINYRGLEGEINERRCGYVKADPLGIERCKDVKRTKYSRYCLQHDTIEGKVGASVTYHSAS